MRKLEVNCTCGDLGEGPCPAHWREAALQDKLIMTRELFTTYETALLEIMAILERLGGSGVVETLRKAFNPLEEDRLAQEAADKSPIAEGWLAAYLGLGKVLNELKAEDPLCENITDLLDKFYARLTEGEISSLDQINQEAPTAKEAAVIMQRDLEAVREFVSAENFECVEAVYGVEDLTGVEFWEREYCAELSGNFLSLDQVVDDYVLGFGEKPENAPEFLHVCGYARVKIKLKPNDTLESVLYRLDDEYGDPDESESTEPTERMLVAEKQLHAVLEEEYFSWACEPVVTVVVNVKQWVRIRGMSTPSVVDDLL